MTDGAIDAPTVAPISVISGPSPHPVPDSEMDALLLGRTRVSHLCQHFSLIYVFSLNYL